MDSSGIVGIYLAAGKSRRMGINKLNLPLDQEYLGSKAFRAALESKLDSTIAVTRQGDSLHWLAPFSKIKGWSRVYADGGQSASLKAGVKAAVELGVEGVVVMLADQPLVPAGLINRLVDEFQKSYGDFYISFLHKGIVTPPILLAKQLFLDLVELDGDQGARALIRGVWKDKGRQIEIEDETYFFDVDTKEDYDLLLESHHNKTHQIDSFNTL